MAENPHRCEVCNDDGSLYLHGRCHPGSPTWSVLTGDVLTIECARCKKVVARFRVDPTPLSAAAASEAISAYDWKPITPESLPGFDDLLLQDMNPPYGAWSVSNKHYKRPVTYEEWMKFGCRWFAKMRLPKDWTPPEQPEEKEDGPSAGD